MKTNKTLRERIRNILKKFDGCEYGYAKTQGAILTLFKDEMLKVIGKTKIIINDVTIDNTGDIYKNELRKEQRQALKKLIKV